MIDSQEIEAALEEMKAGGGPYLAFVPTAEEIVLHASDGISHIEVSIPIEAADSVLLALDMAVEECHYLLEEEIDNEIDEIAENARWN